MPDEPERVWRGATWKLSCRKRKDNRNETKQMQYRELEGKKGGTV